MRLAFGHRRVDSLILAREQALPEPTVDPGAAHILAKFLRVLSRFLDQFVRSNRQVAHPLSRSVKYGVRDRRGRASDPEFAHSASTHRIESVIRFADKMHFNRVYVSVYRHVIIS